MNQASSLYGYALPAIRVFAMLRNKNIRHGESRLRLIWWGKVVPDK